METSPLNLQNNVLFLHITKSNIPFRRKECQKSDFQVSMWKKKCECINEFHHNYEHYTIQLVCQQKYVVCSLRFFITHT